MSKWTSDQAGRDKCRGCPGGHMLSYLLSTVNLCTCLTGELIKTDSHHIPARIPSQVSYLQLNVTL